MSATPKSRGAAVGWVFGGILAAALVMGILLAMTRLMSPSSAGGNTTGSSTPGVPPVTALPGSTGGIGSAFTPGMTNASRPTTSVTTNKSGAFSRPYMPDDPVELTTIGNEYLSQGQTERAVPYLSKAVRLNPEDEETHFNLAFAYSRMGLTNEAIHHYEESLKIFPDYLEAHINLGNLFVNAGQYDKATEHFSTALTIMPEHPGALNNLGRCLAAQGSIETAIEKFSQALRLNPAYLEARFNLGMAYARLKRFEEAATEFSEALRQEPGFKPAALALEQLKAVKSNPGTGITP